MDRNEIELLESRRDVAFGLVIMILFQKWMGIDELFDEAGIASQLTECEDLLIRKCEEDGHDILEMKDQINELKQEIQNAVFQSLDEERDDCDSETLQ